MGRKDSTILVTPRVLLTTRRDGNPRIPVVGHMIQLLWQHSHSPVPNDDDFGPALP
jgi:hypothetical protein